MTRSPRTMGCDPGALRAGLAPKTIQMPSLAHKSSVSRSSGERGFTLVEVLVATTILLIGALGVATMADSANLISTTTKARVGATNLARELLEDARTFKYAELNGDL